VSTSSTVERPPRWKAAVADSGASVCSAPTAGAPVELSPSYNPSRNFEVAPRWGLAVRTTITPSAGIWLPPSWCSINVSATASESGVSPPSTSSCPTARPSASRLAFPRSPAAAGWPFNARSSCLTSIGTFNARSRTCSAPESRSALSTEERRIPPLSEPTKTTAICFPFSRLRASAGYVSLMKVRAAARSRI
jgi:hypothetical protein